MAGDSHRMIIQKSYRKKKKGKIESVKEVINQGQDQGSEKRDQDHVRGLRNIDQGQEKGQRERGQGHGRRFQVGTGQGHDQETEKSIKDGQGHGVLIEMDIDGFLFLHVTFQVYIIIFYCIGVQMMFL